MTLLSTRPPCSQQPLQVFKHTLADHEAMRAYQSLYEESLGFEGQQPMAVAFGNPHYCQANPKFSAEQRFTKLGHDAQQEFTYETALTAELLRNSARWITLFSSWTNEKAGLQFYDTGTLSFLIAEDEFWVRDFSRVYVNLDYM